MVLLFIMTICVTVVLLTFILYCGICDDSGGEVFSENHPATRCFNENKVVFTETINVHLNAKGLDGFNMKSEPSLTQQTGAQVAVGEEICDSDFVDSIVSSQH